MEALPKGPHETSVRDSPCAEFSRHGRSPDSYLARIVGYSFFSSSGIQDGYKPSADFLFEDQA